VFGDHGSSQRECRVVANDRQTRLSRRSSLTLRRDVQSCNSGSQIVTMMQPTKPGHRYNLTATYGVPYCLTTGRRSLREREMCSVAVVVPNVLIHQSFQMTSIEDDHMIEQIAAAVANPALSNPVLPRTPEAGPFRLDTQSLDGTDDLFIKVSRPIENQIPRGGIVGECFAQLLRNPRTVRMLGDVTMQNLPSVMCDDEETIENAECERRHREEVHRGDSFPMIGQKRRPPLRRLRASRLSPHSAQDGSLRNIEAKHRQLAVDAWSTPGWVLSDHVEDEFAQFRADALPASANSIQREPSPIHFESGTAPANNSLRLDENQRLLPPRPEPFKRRPEPPVESSKSRRWMSLLQDRKLLPKRHVL
jgi:hypothetical protein